MTTEVNPSVPLDTGAAVAPDGSRAWDLNRVIDVALKSATLIVLAFMLLMATLLTDRFWDVDNLRNVLSINAPIGLVAIGMTYVIISGNFDLSVGAIFAFSSLIVADLADAVPIWLAVVIAALFGVGFGVANGLVVTKLKVNSFIATIGTGAIISGLAFTYSDSSPIFVDAEGFKTLGVGRVFGIPWSGVVLLAAFLLFGFVLSRTVFGRWIYAAGGNAESARVVGIRVNAVKVGAFAILGGLTALGSVLLASQLQVGNPTLGGTTALDAFAIVIIGGTSVYGGEGALWRTASGLAILAVMENMFNLLSLDAADKSITKGAILVVALGLNALSRSRNG